MKFEAVERKNRITLQTKFYMVQAQVQNLINRAIKAEVQIKTAHFKVRKRQHKVSEQSNLQFSDQISIRRL